VTRIANRNLVIRERRKQRARDYHRRRAFVSAKAQEVWREHWEEARDAKRLAKGWKLLSPRTRQPVGFRRVGTADNGRVWYAPISLAIPGLSHREADDFMEAIQDA
jgi:hypothetical protein